MIIIIIIIYYYYYYYYYHHYRRIEGTQKILQAVTYSQKNCRETGEG